MKKTTFFIALILCLSIIAGCTTATTLPTPLNTLTPVPPTPTLAEATAVSTATNTPAPAVKEQKPEWTLQVAGDGIWAPVTVANGTVYLGSDDKYLYAVDTATKSIQWKFQTGGAVRSRPAVAGEVVYIASDDGYVYAVKTADGTQVWKTQIAKQPTTREADFTINLDFFTSAPTIQDSILYVGSVDDMLYAIDAQTGKVTWKFNAGSGFPIYITPQVADGLVIFADRAGNIFGINAKDGSKTWEDSTGEVFIANGFTLVNQIIYLASGSNLYALDEKTGKTQWKSPTNYSNETPALDNGILYLDVNSPLGPLGTIDAASGKLLKIFVGIYGGIFNCVSPVLGKNNLYIGFIGDGLYAINKKTGEELWKVTVGTGNNVPGVGSTPAIADGLVYLAGLDGKLYVIKDE